MTILLMILGSVLVAIVSVIVGILIHQHFFCEHQWKFYGTQKACLNCAKVETREYWK